jgi:hypothetical protein
MRHWNRIVAAAVGVAACAAQAQAVYRCGNTYGSQPCEGAGVVAPPHVPSRAEGARAVQAAKVDAKRAAALEKARLAQEKNAPKVIVMGPKQPASAAKAAPPLKKPETFSAKSAAPAKKKP